MPKNNLPSTFCPLKWKELMLNTYNNYMYACCRATPVDHLLSRVDQFKELDKQKYNLLNGVQDASCNYCWDIENAGGKSKRVYVLQQFDSATLPDYIHDRATLNLLEVNVGNECNLQCTYCSPKFSSKWEADVNAKVYPLFADRHHYGLLPQIDLLEPSDLYNVPDANKLRIIGGEPLLNKKFWNVIKNSAAAKLEVTTNLMVKKTVIDRLLDETSKFKTQISISIDSTEENAEFVRYGLDYNQVVSNINYLIDVAPDSLSISILSLMTSITIRDLANLVELVGNLRKRRPSIMLELAVTINPRIQSFSTLPDRFKQPALAILEKMDPALTTGIDSVITSLNNSKFNSTLYAELERFVIEFANRKKIVPPLHLIEK